MKSTSLYLLLLACFFATSCAKQKNNAPALTANPYNRAHQIPVSSREEAQGMIARATVQCEGECHPSVGLFTAANEKAITQCTSSLIGEDLLITNSHCIPAFLKANPDRCSQDVKIIFPATKNFPEDTMGCAQLIGFTEIKTTGLSPDMALIRLAKRSSRPFFPFNRTAGVAPDSVSSIVKIDPAADHFVGGTMKREKCIATAKSVLLPNYKSSVSPIITLSNCTVISGNSGSPILNAANELVMVAQAHFIESDIASRREKYKDWFLPETPPSIPMVIGTNGRCVQDISNTAWTIASACLPENEEETDPFNLASVLEDSPAMNAEMMLARDAILKEKTGPLTFFQWDTLTIKDTGFLREDSLFPRCFQSQENWGNLIDAQKLASKPEENLTSIKETALPVPVVQLRFLLNEKFQPYVQTSFSRLEQVRFQFSPYFLGKDNKTVVRNIINDDIFMGKEIPNCKLAE